MWSFTALNFMLQAENMNTVVFSVLHPSVFPYLQDFLYSLAVQTDKEFSVFLLNDGVPNVEEALSRFDLNVQLRNISGTPSSIRKAGIEWVLQQDADTIIFADSDDYFMENRIAVSKKFLSDYDIVFNELLIVGEGLQQPLPILGGRYQDREVITKDSINRLNCMGLSNVAMQTACISRMFAQIPNDIIAFDWAFFFLCLHEGIKPIFTKQTATYYRQHSNNIASLRALTDDQILRGVCVKRDHYQFVSSYDCEYEVMSISFDALLCRLNEDAVFKDCYCRKIRKLAPLLPLWWEAIKTVEDINL
jgi:glycosyltransferase involved in cell wall biosynthesis